MALVKALQSLRTRSRRIPSKRRITGVRIPFLTKNFTTSKRSMGLEERSGVTTILPELLIEKYSFPHFGIRYNLEFFVILDALSPFGFKTGGLNAMFHTPC